MTRDDDQLLDNFLNFVMTESERSLAGQDPGEMAESLRSMLQACHELRRQRQAALAPALPSQKGVPARLQR
jgi:hypothetical protein